MDESECTENELYSAGKLPATRVCRLFKNKNCPYFNQAYVLLVVYYDCSLSVLELAKTFYYVTCSLPQVTVICQHTGCLR